jgi:ParB family chromosome partitioning protein
MTVDTARTHGGLGRGLAALIPTVADGKAPTEVPIDQIRRNPRQPRAEFEQEQLRQLAASVAEHGVLQPVLLTQVPGGFQLIAGERRVRAAEMAGLDAVPAIVRSADEQAQLALALVENLQREDLNPMDEAQAFRQLIDEFGLTQEQVASRVGRSRPSVANTLRLLQTSPNVQRAIREGRVTEGHARALAAFEAHDDQDQALVLVERRALSVRQTEELVRAAQAPVERSASSQAPPDPDLQRLESALRDALGTRVTLSPGRRGGRITIAWFTEDDLARLVDQICGARP